MKQTRSSRSFFIVPNLLAVGAVRSFPSGLMEAPQSPTDTDSRRPAARTPGPPWGGPPVRSPLLPWCAGPPGRCFSSREPAVPDDVQVLRESGLARDNARVRTSKRRSWSIGSEDSILSIGCEGSILSIGSAGSILSIGSAGSILSIGSAGSVASAFSAGSFVSAGCLLSAFSRWSVLAWRAKNPVVLSSDGRHS
jgi:hypothetical protein